MSHILEHPCEPFFPAHEAVYFVHGLQDAVQNYLADWINFWNFGKEDVNAELFALVPEGFSDISSASQSTRVVHQDGCPRPVFILEIVQKGLESRAVIPFHLGPRLREDRCVLGSQHGVMVCDYVTNAVTLGKSAKSGHGAVAINNLFMHTISAWRNGDSEETYDLGEVLVGLFPQCPPPDFRIEKIAAMGHTIQHEDLYAKLSAYRSSPTLTGTIHGDMHAKNILVRNNESILIDFEKLEMRGVVLVDIASLEAGLLDDVFWGDRRSPKDLLQFLRPLYCAKAFQRNRLKRQPTEVASWFYDDVRCIRMNAKNYERQKRQYAWMLATIMLKKACKDKNQDEVVESWGERRDGRTPEDIRAALYILGAELLLSLSSELTAKNDN